jgi:hypothetical protein
VNYDHYRIFHVPAGSSIEQRGLEILSERQQALTARAAYAKTVVPEAIGCWGDEASVKGIIVPKSVLPPQGWAPVAGAESADGVFHAIKPKPYDRTRAARVHAAQLRDELKALPRLPGAEDFARQIGAPRLVLFRTPGSTSFTIAHTTFQILDGLFFLLVPRDNRPKVEGDLAARPENDTYTPEGCLEVPLSRFIAAKEAEDAAAKKPTA